MAYYLETEYDRADREHRASKSECEARYRADDRLHDPDHGSRPVEDDLIGALLLARSMRDVCLAAARRDFAAGRGVVARYELAEARLYHGHVKQAARHLSTITS